MIYDTRLVVCEYFTDSSWPWVDSSISTKCFTGIHYMASANGLYYVGCRTEEDLWPESESSPHSTTWQWQESRIPR